MKQRKWVTIFAIVLSGMTFAGVERSFVAASGGEFGVAENWSGSTLPGDGDTAVIPDGTTVKVSTAASVSALKSASYVRLNGATAKLEIVDQSVDFDGGKPQLQGSGEFSSRSTGATVQTISLRQDNGAFAGRFSFSNVKLFAYGPRAVGGQENGNACQIQHVMTSGTARYHFASGGNYYNPINLDCGSTWYGIEIDDIVGSVITNFGAVTITTSGNAGSRIQTASGYDFVQRGKLTMKTAGNLDINGTAATGRLWLDCEVVLVNSNNNLFSDSTNGRFVFGPHFKMTGGTQIQVTSGNTFSFAGENLLSGTTVGVIVQGTSTLDLDGYDQVFPNYLYPAVGTKITSTHGPATCSLTGTFNTTGNRCSSDLDGHVSLEINISSANVHTISNAPGKVSGTDGSIIVTKGTLKGLPGWTMPNVRSFVVGNDDGNAAKLWISSPAVSLNARANFVQKGLGRLELAEGVTLKVNRANDQNGPLAAGKYARVAGEHVTSCSWIDGDGILEVLNDGIPAGSYVWRGSADDAWSDVANWEVDGSPASRCPVAGDKIALEGDSELIVGDEVSGVVNALAGVFLLDAESVLTLTNRSVAPELGFPIVGAGRIQAKDIGYVDDNVPPAFDCILSGDNSSFTGEFFFTNTSVSVENAKAFGKDSRVTFWGWFSESEPYSQKHLPYLKWRAAGVYENRLFVYGGAMGVMATYCDGGVTNLGDLVYWNGMAGVNAAVVRTRTFDATGKSGGYLAFGGGISSVDPHTGKPATAGGLNLDCNGNVELFGETPLALAAYQMVYSDDGDIVWGKPIESMRCLQCYPKLRFSRANVDISTAVPLDVRCDRNIIIDLDGFDQQFKCWQSSGTLTANRTFSVRSDRPAQLTFKGTSSSDAHATFDGAVSVCLDGAAGDVLTLNSANGGVSTTTGGVWAAGGTFTLAKGMKIPNLGTLRVGKQGSEVAAKVVVADADVVLTPAKRKDNNLNVVFEGVGKLELPSGCVLKASAASVNGQALGVGTYTKANLPNHLDGDGVLQVFGRGLILILK